MRGQGEVEQLAEDFELVDLCYFLPWPHCSSIQLPSQAIFTCLRLVISHPVSQMIILHVISKLEIAVFS